MRLLPFRLALIALSAALPLQAQRVSLQIVARDSAGLAIPYASAVVLASGRIVGADRNGHIPIGGLRLRLDTVLVRAIGFHPALVAVRSALPAGTALTVTLARAPFILPEVTATADSFDPASEFHERARRSGGRFLPRWQIARGGYIRASESMQVVLGIRFGISAETGDVVIRFPGCREEGSRVSVYIDGRELGWSPMKPEEVTRAIDLVGAREVEAMEVYRRRTEIPVRFRTGDACAAVLIWTERMAN
jgi:hypothetical protein